jgi:hypothetical protein
MIRIFNELLLLSITIDQLGTSFFLKESLAFDTLFQKIQAAN